MADANGPSLPVTRENNKTALICYMAAVVLGSATTLWLALSRGQDFNWDQQNYHLGVAFLLEHGTFWSSIAPVGSQSYLNPYVIQAEFWAMNWLSPKIFTASLASIQSLAFVFSGIICAIIVRPVSDKKNLILGLLGFVLCLAAPMSLSEIGTTFTDIATSVLVLAAYAALLADAEERNPHLMLPVLAGSLLGAATALKLTNGVFAVAAVGFAIGGQMSSARRLRQISLVYGATVLGFLVVGGWWYGTLWRHFGNPFFPYFNGIFRSPGAGLTELRDTRFLAKSVLDIWRYPLYWLVGGAADPKLGSPSSELPFIDGRWVVAIFGITVLLVSSLVSRSRARILLRTPAAGLLFAFLIGYILWLFAFGIHRYLIPLDILCGAVILLLVGFLPSYPLKIGIMASLVAAVLFVMQIPNWGHRPWAQQWQPDSHEIVHLPPRSLVFMTDRPSLMVALSLPGDTRYAEIMGVPDLSASNDTRLTRQLRRELTLPTTLEEEDQGVLSDHAAQILEGYGLRATNSCSALISAGRRFRICRVRPVGK